MTRMSTIFVLIILQLLCSCYSPPEYEAPPAPQRKVRMISPTDTSSVVSVRGSVHMGRAAYISDNYQGELTANGERYDRERMTAAHVNLPFGTRCRVTNQANGRSIEVRINDRSAHKRGRIIELSYAAMAALGGIRDGVIEVRMEVLPQKKQSVR